MKKKPPDKYKTLKIKLKDLLHIDVDYTNLFSVIDRTNKLTIIVLQFMRAFILYKHSFNNNSIPKIDKNFIVTCFNICSVNNGKGPKSDVTSFLYRELELFYNVFFKMLINQDKIDREHLSQVINYAAITILANIETNIKEHFFKYVDKFVNSSFKEKEKSKNILDKLDKKNRVQKNRELKKELREVKNDLRNNTILCKPKYHQWLNKYRKIILPDNYDTSYEHDVQIYPQKYIPYMITMNILLENMGSPLFQFFPLRTDVVPKYCTIDTKTVIQMFMKNQGKFLENVELYKDYIWSEHFFTKHRIFKLKNFTFDNSISTDGYAVSIRFIHNSYIEGNKKKNKNKKEMKMKIKEMCENLSEIESDKLREKINKEKEEKSQKIKSEYLLKIKERKKEERERIKKLPIEEQKLIKEEKNMKSEFPYIDKMSYESLQTLKDKTLVNVDPGKNRLITCIDNNDVYYSYSNGQRIHETKRVVYRKQREKRKKKEIGIGNSTIEKIESELTMYNSKTCDLNEFMLYISKKTEINKKIFNIYEDEFYRKLRWYNYLNTKRSEDKLMETLKKTYGKGAIFVIGDWGDTGRLKYMSTPGIGLRRKIGKKFKVYLMDEYRTSCLNYKTEERSENMYYTDKKGVIRELHSVLMYQTDSGNKGCINRDRNAVYNMRKILRGYIETGERIEKYKRGEKKEEKKEGKTKRIQKQKILTA